MFSKAICPRSRVLPTSEKAVRDASHRTVRRFVVALRTTYCDLMRDSHSIHVQRTSSVTVTSTMQTRNSIVCWKRCGEREHRTAISHSVYIVPSGKSVVIFRSPYLTSYYHCVSFELSFIPSLQISCVHIARTVSCVCGEFPRLGDHSFVGSLAGLLVLFIG